MASGAAVDRSVPSLTVAWKRCSQCQQPGQQPGRASTLTFKSPREFCAHLREYHCTREGGSYVCHYGPNGVCPSLPVDGVSDRDYEDHVARDHVAGTDAAHRSSSRSGSLDSEAATTPSSLEPSVVQDQFKWTAYMAKINMPAVLNDPRLARREADFFTKTWGEGFEKGAVLPSSHIPHISRDHFRKYLKKTAARLQGHLKRQAAAATERSQSSQDDTFQALHTRQIDKFGAEFESIPKIFLLPHFNLENPLTFNTVFPWTQIETSRQTGSDKPVQSSKLLQEKLSHYLDLVEVQIAKQISLRSEAFFHAMSSHDKLQIHLSQTCASIKHLRDKIHRLDQTLVEGPLKIMKLERSRSNHVAVFNKLKLMATVHQTQPTIQLLLGTNEFVGALDLISTTQEVLTQELGGLHCFRHLGSQLAEMEKLIDKMMQEDFIHYATADLNRPLTAQEVEAMEEDTDDFAPLTDAQEKLVAIVFGFLRQHKFTFIDVYRDEAFTALKAIIKQTVIEAVAAADDIDTEGHVGSLADQMRLLNYQKWTELLNKAFADMLIVLRRVKSVCSVMEEVLQASSGDRRQSHASSGSETVFEQNGINHTANHEQTPPLETTLPQRVSVSNDVDILLSQAEYVKVSKDLREMLCQVCDHAHDRCVKLLVARSKDGFLERLSSSEFVRLSRSVEGFVTNCEMLCGRKSTSLRASLQSQASRFVNRFHEERKQKLSLILDNERWKQADVPVEFQDLVNHLSTTGKLCLPERKKKTGPDKTVGEFLSVNGERYAVVGTVLMLLKMVVEYCQCVDDLGSAAPDILTRLIELLKMFNSRTCQLILGAGALQLVGLKTITTKNLALASRCLQLVVYYLPKVRQHFETKLHGKQVNMIKNFEHVLKDYNDHIAEIANKLVAIADSMLDSNLSKWEVRAPMPSTCFRGVCRQMGKLHEAIVELLPQDQVVELFERINRSFMTHLRLQLIRLSVTKDGGPQHGLVVSDVSFYLQSMKSLSGLQNISDNMDSIWDQR